LAICSLGMTTELYLEQCTGCRRSLRDQLLPQVSSGTKTILRIQKGIAPWKTVFWNAMSIVGSHDFFLLFFPMIAFGFGYNTLCGKMSQRATMGVYFGNWIKDYLCLPRPPCPPVQQLNHSGNLEFGLPSTHAVTAVCLPFFSLFFLLPVEMSVSFIGFFVVALLYMYLISYSRLYLGMHSPADVISGTILGLVILVGGWLMDLLIEHFHIVLPTDALSIFLLGGLVLLAHPEPFGACPCFEDSACFVGAFCGYVTGTYRDVDTNGVINWSPILFILRWLTSAVIVFVGRLVYKPLVRKIVTLVCDQIGLPHFSYVYSKGSDVKPFPSPKWNIAILCKYIVYFLIVEHCFEFTPSVVTALGWW